MRALARRQHEESLGMEGLPSWAQVAASNGQKTCGSFGKQKEGGEVVCVVAGWGPERCEGCNVMLCAVGVG